MQTRERAHCARSVFPFIKKKKKKKHNPVGCRQRNKYTAFQGQPRDPGGAPPERRPGRASRPGNDAYGYLRNEELQKQEP